MSPRSENGWPAYDDTTHFVRHATLGFSYWAANADVADIFDELITRYVAHVQPISGPRLDDWSWASRNVRGSGTIISNHASATAIDLNALAYPRGTQHMSAAHVGAVHKMLAFFDGIVRWGGDYRDSPKDQMHFEIHGEPWVAELFVRHKIHPIRTGDDDEMMTAADWTKLRGIVHDEIVNVLTTEKVVENLPLHPDDPTGSKWTVSGVLAANDKKADATLELINRLTAKGA